MYWTTCSFHCISDNTPEHHNSFWGDKPWDIHFGHLNKYLNINWCNYTSIHAAHCLLLPFPTESVTSISALLTCSYHSQRFPWYVLKFHLAHLHHHQWSRPSLGPRRPHHHHHTAACRKTWWVAVLHLHKRQPFIGKYPNQPPHKTTIRWNVILEEYDDSLNSPLGTMTSAVNTLLCSSLTGTWWVTMEI